ncbi:MAG: NUDIX hydrolase [Planctomycetota bacterium]
MRTHGPWKILRNIPIYRDPWIEVSKDEVIRPDGKPGTHAVVTIKSGVCVLPIHVDGTVYLTQEFHYGVGRSTLEAVSGGMEPGEDPLLTARRELREELGIEAEHWEDLGVVDPFTAVGTSPTRLFLARHLSFVAANPEGTERIQSISMTLTEAADAVLNSQITHAPSSVLILKAAHRLLALPGSRDSRPREPS